MGPRREQQLTGCDRRSFLGGLAAAGLIDSPGTAIQAHELAPVAGDAPRGSSAIALT
jgi:hypothetical protein